MINADLTTFGHVRLAKDDKAFSDLVIRAIPVNRYVFCGEVTKIEIGVDT